MKKIVVGIGRSFSHIAGNRAVFLGWTVRPRQDRNLYLTWADSTIFVGSVLAQRFGRSLIFPRNR